MSESRFLRHPGTDDADTWRTAFDELDLRFEALRETVLEGARSFTLGDEQVERVRARFNEIGDQWQAMHCMYPFAGRPGVDACRVEPAAPYKQECGEATAGRGG